MVLAPALTALATLRAAHESTRRFLYRSGFLSAASLPAPVISIGNLTGASGKTPYVEYLARHYWKVHSLPSLILQLGSGTVDETVMLRHAFEGSPVQVTDSRSPGEVRELLLSNPSLRLVLLDDGLQHLPLMRDLDCITVSALSPLGNGHLWPRGTLREPAVPALRRADALMLHHVDIGAAPCLPTCSASCPFTSVSCQAAAFMGLPAASMLSRKPATCCCSSCTKQHYTHTHW